MWVLWGAHAIRWRLLYHSTEHVNDKYLYRVGKLNFT